jgi:hypothetical protein
LCVEKYERCDLHHTASEKEVKALQLMEEVA